MFTPEPPIGVLTDDLRIVSGDRRAPLGRLIFLRGLRAFCANLVGAGGGATGGGGGGILGDMHIASELGCLEYSCFALRKQSEET